MNMDISFAKKAVLNMKIPELLAPAGNMEKAKIAIAYGADAIYLSGRMYGMRAGAGNFSDDELKEVVNYAHERQVRVYVTVNIIAHNQHLVGIPEYIKFLAEIGVDAIIVSDPGIMQIAKTEAPKLALHLSTQANTTNQLTAKFWSDMGYERLVMAREVNRRDLAEICANVEAEIELFVHGAMCMAYSGRCLMSGVMTGREANLGACAQSCRWKYSVMEESRPGEHYPIEETAEGTYIFNSKDLCLLEQIPELIKIGVDSLKIEGRMKSVFYVGTVVRAYRKALDDYQANPDGYQLDPELLDEVNKVSHRPYYTGFFLNEEQGTHAGTHTESSAYMRDYDFVGVVEGYDYDTGQAIIAARNYLPVGAQVEIIQPRAGLMEITVTQITNAKNGEALDAGHANYRVKIPMPEVKPLSMLRVLRAKGSDA